MLAPTTVAQGTEQPATSDSFITTSDGIKIHYLEAGKGAAILFVPGWTIPAWIWERQIGHFSKSFHVIAMDQRAQGESTQASEGLYPAARARDIKAVVDQLKLAPVVLVGWSMGVAEICAYVDQFGTDGIADLILVDGVPGFDLPPERLKGLIGFFGSFQKDRRKATEDFVRGMYKKPQTEDYLQRVIKASLATPTNSAAALSLGAMSSDYWGARSLRSTVPRWWWQPSRRLSPRTRGCSGRFPGRA